MCEGMCGVCCRQAALEALQTVLEAFSSEDHFEAVAGPLLATPLQHTQAATASTSGQVSCTPTLHLGCCSPVRSIVHSGVLRIVNHGSFTTVHSRSHWRGVCKVFGMSGSGMACRGPMRASKARTRNGPCLSCTLSRLCRQPGKPRRLTQP